MMNLAYFNTNVGSEPIFFANKNALVLQSDAVQIFSYYQPTDANLIGVPGKQFVQRSEYIQKDALMSLGYSRATAC